jgi:D-beta-D-heptose 7-phosphate kinase/D-beta-D-heptose 1-phosphate adenosyltransferase
VKILVIGDVMLDQYWSGTVQRISPEAPVPVVRLQEKKLVVGGAANVASNIAGLMAKPYLLGVVGNDPESKILPQLLAELSISADYLVSLDDRPTTVKTRIVAHHQHIVRIDQEEKIALNPKQEEKVWEMVEKIIDEIDLIVISDYAKGLLTEKILVRLITIGNKKQKKILVDPKGKDFSKYKGATLLTPNLREATEACKLEDEDYKSVEKAGPILLKELDLHSLLITQGEDGMTLFEKNTEAIHFSAASREVFDVTGAGDTVIATLAVVLAAGGDLTTAAKTANTAAGIVVEHFGTTSITLSQLEKSLDG